MESVATQRAPFCVRVPSLLPLCAGALSHCFPRPLFRGCLMKKSLVSCIPAPVSTPSSYTVQPFHPSFITLQSSRFSLNYLATLFPSSFLFLFISQLTYLILLHYPRLLFLVHFRQLSTSTQPKLFFQLSKRTPLERDETSFWSFLNTEICTYHLLFNLQFRIRGKYRERKRSGQGNSSLLPELLLLRK